MRSVIPSNTNCMRVLTINSFFFWRNISGLCWLKELMKIGAQNSKDSEDSKVFKENMCPKDSK